MAEAGHVTLIAQVRPKHLSLDTHVTFFIAQYGKV